MLFVRDKVGGFPGIALKMVKFGHVFVRGTISVRIADVFPLVGAESSDVGRVRKLLLVIVFVIPTGAPVWITIGHELLPGATLSLWERRRTTDLEN